MRALLRLFRLLPSALEAIELAHLRLARRQLCPLHPDMPDIVRRIADLERPA